MNRTTAISAPTVTWTRWVRRDYPRFSGLEETTETSVEMGGYRFPASIVQSLGADHMGYILGLPDPAAYCRGRSRGWWDANDLESSAKYDAIAQIISGVARTEPIKATL